VKNIWIFKGVLLGFGLFFLGSLVYVGNKLRPFEAQKATGVSALTAPTLYNPWWWIAFVITLAVGCAMVRYWPHSSVAI
jgi:hypothetical protein